MNTDKVLLADDDKSTRDAVKRLLELHGIETDYVESADAARVKLAYHEYGLILCNDAAARNDEGKFIKEIRTSPRHYLTPVIVLSDMTDDNARRSAMNLGADDCFTKPFAGKVLLSSIKSMMAAARQRRMMVLNDINERLFSLLNKNFNQELLTPLNGIVNTMFLIENMEGVHDVDGLNELVNAVHASSYRMLRTTQNLLTYSALNVERDAANVRDIKDVRLQDVLQTVAGFYENGLTPDTRKIDVNVLQVGTWCGPEDYMRTLFTELIDNAVKFSPADTSPVVDLRAINNSFTFSVTNELREPVHFTVRDISPFRKFHHDLSRNGLGLGLFISKNICDRMGYQLSLQHKSGLLTATVVCDQPE